MWVPHNGDDEVTKVPGTLRAVARRELDDEAKSELATPDPEDAEAAIASLVASGDAREERSS